MTASSPDIAAALYAALGPTIRLEAYCEDAEPEPAWLRTVVSDPETLRSRLGVYGRHGFETWLRPRYSGLIHGLWVRVEGSKQARALASFRPAPSVVLREGETTRRWAIWPLSAGLDYEWAVRCNKRLAHRMRAAKKWASPDDVAIPATCLNHRARPLPIVVEKCEGEMLRAREIVGHLRDAPDPDAWRKQP